MTTCARRTSDRKPARPSGRRWLSLALAAGLLLSSALAAQAHKGAGEGPPDAATWVRQALAFLELRPPNVGEARERVEGALKAKDPQGVDLALVREALDALTAREIPRAAAALSRALQPPAPAAAPSAAVQARPGVPAPAPAAPSATAPAAAEEVATRTTPGAPLRALEPRFAGTPSEYALLAVGGALVGLGLLALRRTGRHAREAVR